VAMLTGYEQVVIESRDIRLRPVTPADVNDVYVGWMNDREVNQYMETRHRSQTMRDIELYVKAMIERPDVLFLAIIFNGTNTHVGNIKLEVVSQIHRRGEISLFVGDKKHWGKGIGSQAVTLLRDFACSTLRLHKLSAGCYSNNLASARVFEKAGFTREAVLKEHYLCGHEWVDRYCYAFVEADERLAQRV